MTPNEVLRECYKILWSLDTTKRLITEIIADEGTGGSGPWPPFGEMVEQLKERTVHDR